MSTLRFEWDKAKERSNRKKHGVAFSEAQTVFYDEAALLIADPDHSESEDRFVLMGLSASLHVVLVCHCYRHSDTVVRIISARKADADERAEYWKRRK